MYELIKKIADSMNISPSEYLRFLIIQDLEKRSLLTSKIDRIKQELLSSQK
jgi:hypothetical protein